MPTATSCSIRRWIHVYLLVVLSILVHFSAFGAPTKEKRPKEPENSGRGGETIYFPERTTTPAAIAGVIMTITGFFLCFFAIKCIMLSVFLIGFYLFGNLTYIAMSNLGVSSGTWLLVGTLLAATILGGLRLFKPPGAEVLGPLAMHCITLWILSWKPGGLVTSGLGKSLMFGILDVLGFMFVYIPDHAVAGAICFPVLGAYTFIAGIDFFTRTGFLQHADTFVNTKSNFDPKILAEITATRYYLPIGLIAALTVLGIIVQLTWGNEEYKFNESKKAKSIFWHSFKVLVGCGFEDISCIDVKCCLDTFCCCLAEPIHQCLKCCCCCCCGRTTPPNG